MIKQTMQSFVKIPTKYAVHDPCQVQISNAFMMFAAGDLMPLSVVDSKYFCNFLKKMDPRYQVPSQNHLSSNLLSDKKVYLEMEVSKNLKEWIT